MSGPTATVFGLGGYGRDGLGSGCDPTGAALNEKLDRAWQRGRYVDLPRHLMDENLRRQQDDWRQCVQ